MFAPFAFQKSLTVVLIAMPLWSIGYATQDTLLKVLVAGILPEGKRNTAFGFFYIGYGCGWLVGSDATGLLYDCSLTALAIFVAVAQFASVQLFLMGRRNEEAGI